jgi:hypothetical protein
VDLVDQIGDQAYKDGLALRRVREDEDAWAAMGRLIQRLHDDLIQQWTDDTTGARSKKWLKGARETCDAFIPAMEQTIRNAEDVIQEKKDLESASRSRADDGVGSGDLAI